MKSTIAEKNKKMEVIRENLDIDIAGNITSRPGENLTEFLCDVLAHLRDRERYEFRVLAEAVDLSLVWVCNLIGKKFRGFERGQIQFPTMQKLYDFFGYDIQIRLIKRK